jgi:hypothetical protein
MLYIRKPCLCRLLTPSNTVATTTAVIGSWATAIPLVAVAGVLALNRKWAAAPAPSRI